MKPLITDRRFGEKYYLQEWIRPHTASVELLAKILTDKVDDVKDKILNCYKYVVVSVNYPFFLGIPCDTHFRIDFLQKILCNALDLWYFPEETLADTLGDCEDATFVCASLLRTFLKPQDVFAVLGTVEIEGADYGHAWAEVKIGNEWFVLENTLDIPPEKLMTTEEAYKNKDVKYKPQYWFNDVAFKKAKDAQDHLEESLYWQLCNRGKKSHKHLKTIRRLHRDRVL